MFTFLLYDDNFHVEHQTKCRKESQFGRSNLSIQFIQRFYVSIKLISFHIGNVFNALYWIAHARIDSSFQTFCFKLNEFQAEQRHSGATIFQLSKKITETNGKLYECICGLVVFSINFIIFIECSNSNWFEICKCVCVWLEFRILIYTTLNYILQRKHPHILVVNFYNICIPIKKKHKTDKRIAFFHLNIRFVTICLTSTMATTNIYILCIYFFSSCVCFYLFLLNLFRYCEFTWGYSNI